MVSEVSLATARFVAATVPKFTADALVKPVPVTVTGSPPPADPLVGLTWVTTGDAAAPLVDPPPAEL